MSKVGLVRCSSYEAVGKAVSQAVELLGGISQFVKPGSKVLVKPNLCDPFPPEKGVTTHPAVIKAVAQLVHSAGAEVWIGDLSAGDLKGRTAECFEVCGLHSLQEGYVKLLNFQEGEFVTREIGGARELTKVKVPAPVLEADTIINLPKLKTHFKSFLTGAVKNCFGCVAPQDRKEAHSLKDERFNQSLVDIYSLIKPQLTIMDAVYCLDWTGHDRPIGDPTCVGMILAGADGVSVDSVAAKVTGHSPLAIPTTRYAHNRKVGNGNLAELELMGEPLKAAGFDRHPMYDQYVNNLRKKESMPGMRFVPYINKNQCQRCGACIQSCPVNCISESFEIDQDRCIGCLCCKEVCIHGAVELSTKLVKSLSGDRSLDK